jgi:translocator protein
MTDNRPQNGRVPGPDPGELVAPAERPETAVEPAGAAPRRRIDTSSEWYWPVVNLLGLAAAISVNILANTVPFNGLTTGEVVRRDPVYFQPAGWTFSIWSLIYLLLVVFVVYTFLPIGRRESWLSMVGPAFLVANLANIAWLVLWHWERWTLTLVAMGVLLAVLALIYWVLRRDRRFRQPPTAERLMVWTPFSVYLGWVTVAFLANISVWLDREGSDLFGMGGRWAAVALIGIALAATAWMIIWWRDPTYAVVVGWGLLGIVAEQWDRSKPVAFAAIVAAVLVAALAVFGSLLAFELRLTHDIRTAPRHEARRPGFMPWRDRSEAREDGPRE